VQHHWKKAGSYSTVGLELSLSILLGLYFGQWLDEKYDLSPWMTLFWSTAGVAAGIRSLYRALQRANREAEAEQKAEEEAAQKYFDDPDSN
jgi:F0F1-type ATP synthase assembly protein I